MAGASSTALFVASLYLTVMARRDWDKVEV
jgi:hypothetical protein